MDDQFIALIQPGAFLFNLNYRTMNNRDLFFWMMFGILMSMLVVTAIERKDSQPQPLKKKDISLEAIYETRFGRVSHNHIKRPVIIQTIDGGKSWLVITPSKEVMGYFHKLLPKAHPDSLQKVSPVDDGLFSGGNHLFYYGWL